MNIEINDVLTLDNDKRYGVCSIVSYEGFKYYYLVEEGNLNNTMVCKEKDGKLIKIEDEVLMRKLLPKFLIEAKDILKQVFNGGLDEKE